MDNQAAIQSVHNPGGQSGQLILRQIIHFIGILQKRGVSIEICWIPAHTGVPGNEKADVIAKQATGWRAKGRTGQRAPQSKWVQQLLSSCKRTVRETVLRMWKDTWTTQATGRQYRSHFGSEIISQKKGAQLYQGLTKPEAAILVQLRSGKIGLGGYLKRIKVVDTAVCQCQRSNETVSHILGDCFQFGAQRRTYLGQPTIWNVPALLSDSKLARKAVAFMKSTRLLDQFSRC